MEYKSGEIVEHKLNKVSPGTTRNATIAELIFINNGYMSLETNKEVAYVF